MNQEEFDAFLEERFDKIRAMLASKGAEYAPDEDDGRFHNFYVAAGFNNETPERALWGMLTKHLVSLSDMVQGESTDQALHIWEEKIGDAINYLLLLHGMVEYHHGCREEEGLLAPLHLTPVHIRLGRDGKPQPGENPLHQSNWASAASNRNAFGVEITPDPPDPTYHLPIRPQDRDLR